ncbi:putative small nuclear ribonucleoprotein F [Bienertia sinuspersici]
MNRRNNAMYVHGVPEDEEIEDAMEFGLIDGILEPSIEGDASDGVLGFLNSRGCAERLGEKRER